MLFFTSVSEVLRPWLVRSESGGVLNPGSEALLDQALSVARKFAIDGERDPETRALLRALESEGPAEDSDSDGLTAGTDAWVSADIALRIALGECDSSAGMWYVLEPQHVATTDRLFGCSDVGSDREERDEAKALADPELATAVEAVETVLRDLAGTPEPTVGDLRKTTDRLRPLCP